MKTNEEILARYLSPESVDIFGAQRIALLCMLPFEMAKPYLHPDYVKASEDDSLPEDEAWRESVDIKEQILVFMPLAYESLKQGNEMETLEGLLYLKSWIWAVDEEFHDEIAPMFEEDFLDQGKGIIDKIANHLGYIPVIQDVDFEEVPEEESKDE